MFAYVYMYVCIYREGHTSQVTLESVECFPSEFVCLLLQCPALVAILMQASLHQTWVLGIA